MRWGRWSLWLGLKSWSHCVASGDKDLGSTGACCNGSRIVGRRRRRRNRSGNVHLLRRCRGGERLVVSLRAAQHLIGHPCRNCHLDDLVPAEHIWVVK